MEPVYPTRADLSWIVVAASKSSFSLGYLVEYWVKLTVDIFP